MAWATLARLNTDSPMSMNPAPTPLEISGECDPWRLCMARALEQIDASQRLKGMLSRAPFGVADAVRDRYGATLAAGDPDTTATH